MSTDLIFHVVSKRKWRELNKDGYYRPESSITDDPDLFVECVRADRINEFLNEHFRKRKNLFLLVIDKSRIVNSIKNDKEKGTVNIAQGINTDAILDKIRLDANPDGGFDLNISIE